MFDCLSSRHQNPSAAPPDRQNLPGLRLGEAGRSMRQGLHWITLLLVTLAGAHPSANGQNPSLVGQFSPVMSWPYNPTHAVLLPNGNVLWWPSFANGGKPQIWDPVSNNNTAVTPPGYNIFCGAHSVLEDGQVFITGGDSALNTGVANASLYDPVSGNWTFLPDMNAGRWYPTNTVLPNGDVVVTSGNISPLLGVNALPQVWQVSSGTWRDLTTAQLDLELYPEIYLAPNGTLFFAGPTQVSRYLNTDGTGSWTTGPTMEYGPRGYGPSVMYNNGQIMVAGGGGGPTATAEIINLNNPVPIWSYTGSMANARRNANATLLPDGTVLVTGGTSGAIFDDPTHAVFPDELWNPATGTWSTMASLSIYRGYHSVAVLLPDGRVLSGGGQCYGDPGCNPNSTEIFSPPYLFAGPRPTISSAPAGIGGGQTFFVGTPDAANITQVTWIRLGAVTHTFNQEQRISFLSFSQTTGGLNVTAPPSANLAPAGYYMLFLLNSGVPSVASIIQVDNSSFATPGPAVSVSQTSLVFAGKTPVGATTHSQSLQLTNLGTTPVTINSITAGTDFTVTSNTCGTQLAPGSCTINVAFRPTMAGQLNELLTISDSDPSSPQIVALSGLAEALKFSASAVNFGNESVGMISEPISVTLTNLATAAIGITSISYSNPEFSEYFPGSTCGTSIPGLSSCQLSSVFAPSASGSQSGTFSVVDSDPSSPTTVQLSGVGIASGSFIQVASATPQTKTTTVSVTYPAAQTAGDLNIVAVGWNDTTSTVQSVKDSLGNTYSLAIGPTIGTGLQESIYYATNIVGGSNTVTVTFNQSANGPDIRILEYRGVTTLDAKAGASGNSTAANSGSATTTSANELIFGADMVATATGAAGSGFTSRIITQDGDIAEDEVATTAGSNSATATLDGSGPWVMQMATFSSAAVAAPTVTSVSPNSGSTAGGTAVTITGTNFASGATVTFGGTAATNVVVASSTTITATTPAQAAGAVTVTVTVNGQSGSLANAFTYLAAPTVTSVSPNSGSTAGGTAVTITGTNFASGATVTFGGTAATNVVVASSTTITATTPAHAAGAVTVTVTVNGQSGSLANGFTYTATGTISFIQVASATPQTKTTTVSVTYPAAQTAGDLNIVAVGWNDTTSTVQSVKDSVGNTYSLAIGPTIGTGLQESIYYATNIVGGSNTVTVTFNQSANGPDIRILEYRGVTTLDAKAGASGNSTAANSGSATTTSANELIFGADMVATTTGAAGSGFTSRIITSPDGDIAEDKVVTTAGSNSATATLDGSGPWVMQMVTFK
jgi:hypothetical protein